MTTQPKSSVRYDSSPRSTRSRVLGVAISLMVVMPGIALAQSPRPPIVELGVQGSKRSSDHATPVSWSPRLTLNLTPQTAIEATADIQRAYGNLSEGELRSSAREFGVHWRQTVFTSGRWQVFGVLGAGRNRVELNIPGRIAQDPDGPRVIPQKTSVMSGFVAHFGPAVQVELTRWLALRGDLRVSLGQRDSGVRGLAGMVIPIGRFRDGGDPPDTPAPPATAIPDAKPKPAGSKFPPASWRRLKPGREVWVTTNSGSLVHGDIAAISDSSLSIREQDREVTIGIDDVRWVEGRDSLKNGFLIGAASGAVSGGVFFGVLCSALCEGDDSFGAILFGAASGGVVVGLLGLMVDGLIPGRQTLFWGSTTVVTPVMTPTKKAVDVTIRWR